MRHEQTVSELIKVTMTVTHWATFYVPGVGFGGMFGVADLGERMEEIFVGAERINEGESLIS